jgi:hypothetical protein
MTKTTSVRREAASAARALIETRIRAVQDLASAIEDHERAQREVEDAERRVREAAAAAREQYQAAKSAGWTTAELRGIGLEAPPAPRRRREEPAENGGQAVSAASDLDEPSPAGEGAGRTGAEVPAPV